VITSNGGTNFSVSTSTVALRGRAWIDVHDIGLAGAAGRLPVTWLDDQQWQIVLPLAEGSNNIQLAAYDYHGREVGQASIAIVASISGASPRDSLRISELMYDPSPPSAAEVLAGFSNNDDFEFMELVNTAAASMSLAGVKVTAGVAFDFTAGAITNLAPGARVLVVANQAAFQFRYGTNLPVTGVYSGHFNNRGEFVQLTDALGNVIQEFTYQTVGGWPIAAGNGRSIEVIDLHGDDNDPANWQASLAVGGTPGEPAVIGRAFIGAAYAPDGIHLRFNADPGQSYTVYRDDDLTAGSWSRVAQIPVSPSPTIQEIVDNTPLGAGSRRFYRLSSP
jgi:hypothetical protein